MINGSTGGRMDVCRSCMRETADIKNLFAAKNPEGDDDENGLQLADMLMACASVQVVILICFF